MQSFFEWFGAENIDANQPWLILGKGPSFAGRHQYDLSRFLTLSLNHAVRDQRVTVAHMIDFEVIDACAEAVQNNAEVLVMPWVPHVGNYPGQHDLGRLAEQHPVLRRMDEQGRLLWYNLCTAPEKHGDSPVVEVNWFSAEAVLNLLSMAGVRQVRSLGVDGGANYSQEFDDLKDKTLLANGHESFDKQFAEIRKIIRRTGLTYGPLDVETPIRVYVGSMEDQMLAVKVLEYSIQKHVGMSVEVFPLHLAPVPIPQPKDLKNAPRTPFSFQRFLIPEWAGHRGRAIYLDSDMQVFTDIRRLWATPFDGADLLAARSADDAERRPQFSVMLLNCEALRWDIREIVNRLDGGELSYEQLMYEMAVAKRVRAAISPHWNSLEHYEAGRTALIHYTDMPTQPWVSRDNRFGFLWLRDLFAAIDEGFITEDYVKEHVARGYVRPSILYQIETRLEDALVLPKKATAMDNDFVPPYKSLPHVQAAASHPARNNNVFWLKVRRTLMFAQRRLRARLGGVGHSSAR